MNKFRNKELFLFKNIKNKTINSNGNSSNQSFSKTIQKKMYLKESLLQKNEHHLYAC